MAEVILATNVKCYGTVTPEMMAVIRGYPDCASLTIYENGQSNGARARSVWRGVEYIVWDNSMNALRTRLCLERRAAFAAAAAAAAAPRAAGAPGAPGAAEEDEEEGVDAIVARQKTADRATRPAALEELNAYIRDSESLRSFRLEVCGGDNEFMGLGPAWRAPPWAAHYADVIRSIAQNDRISSIEIHGDVCIEVDRPAGRRILDELTAMIAAKPWIERLSIGSGVFLPHSTALTEIAKAAALPTAHLGGLDLSFPHALGDVAAFEAVADMLMSATDLQCLFLHSVVVLTPQQSARLADLIVLRTSLLRTDLTLTLTPDDLIDRVIPNSSLTDITIMADVGRTARFEHAVEAQPLILRMTMMPREHTLIDPEFSSRIQKLLNKRQLIQHQTSPLGIGLK